MAFDDLLSSFVSEAQAAMSPYSGVAYLTAEPGDSFSSHYALQVTPSGISPLGEPAGVRLYSASVAVTIWWMTMGDIEQRADRPMSGSNNVYDMAVALRDKFALNTLSGALKVPVLFAGEDAPVQSKGPWMTIRQSYKVVYEE